MDQSTNSNQSAGSAPPPETNPSGAPGEDRNAPIPDAVAENVQPETLARHKAGKPIAGLAALGQAFVKSLPDEAQGGIYRPRGNDAWAGRPLELEDGWHHDEATNWNFLVRNGRLFEAKSDRVMANQPFGTFGRAHRAV